MREQQPLNLEQQELLSAWLDGEATTAEQAVAEELLKRDDAKQYVAELEKTRLLVSTHALAKAPAALNKAVLAAIKPAPIRQLPAPSWRTPVYAAAAAILVAMAIMFVPALISPNPAPATQIAVEDLPVERRVETAPELPTAMSQPANEARLAEEPADMLDREVSRAAKKQSELAKGADSKLEEKDGDSNTARRFARDEAERAKDMDSRAQGDGVSDKSDPAMPKPAAEVEGLKGLRVGGDSKAKADDEASRETRGGEGGGLRARGNHPGASGGVSPPAAPPEEVEDTANADSEAQGVNTPIVKIVELNAAEKLAAQTDAMWIAALYGKVELVEQPGGVETVRVQVSPDRVDELTRALRKIATQPERGPTDARKDQGGTWAPGFVPPAPKAQPAAEGTAVVLIRIS